MGQEISVSHFKQYDFRRFERLIDEEMELLRAWFRDRRFSEERAIGGLELETWIVDPDGNPLAWNDELLRQIQSPDVVRELSRFNVEFNVDPQPLAHRGIRMLQLEMEATWKACDRAAAELGGSVVAIGILPTITESLLSLQNMSSSLRFRALNEQVLRLRQGAPIRVDIEGRERLKTEHFDVMLEAASTSFQLHLQVPFSAAIRYYNASLIVAAPLVAVSANSPLLFGKMLWDESRIPLFEQSSDTGGGRFPRVTFGSGYLENSIEECFIENREHYPVMLPLVMDDASSELAHVRLHNGTIWRWVRALIGFDKDRVPHLRVEQRVPPAGPTSIDMAANMAFYYGLVESLATSPIAPETRLLFATARANFYLAARYGLEAQLIWLDQRALTMRQLLLELLLPLADQGLKQIEVDAELSARLLGVIESRVMTGQNGAVWQRRFLELSGRELPTLTREYRQRQRSGEPVHSWSL